MIDDLDLIRKCHDANEFGDAILHRAANQGKFCYVPELDTWRFFAGVVWRDDLAGLDLAAVERVAEAYLKLADDCQRQKQQLSP